MSIVASTASCDAGAVGTGTRAIVRSGASSEPPASAPATAARISASVTIPTVSSPSSTSRLETPSSPSLAAAARTVSCAPRYTGGRMIAETGVVPVSSNPCTV
jgi:hypothetical protein